MMKTSVEWGEALGVDRKTALAMARRLGVPMEMRYCQGGQRFVFDLSDAVAQGKLTQKIVSDTPERPVINMANLVKAIMLVEEANPVCTAPKKAEAVAKLYEVML